MKGLPDKPNLRPDEVAEFFDTSVKNLKRWIKDGKYFDPSRILKFDGGGLRFPREEVIRVYEFLCNRDFEDVEYKEKPKGKKTKRTVRSTGVKRK